MNTKSLTFNKTHVVSLSPEDARWVRSKYARIRASQVKADKAAAEWEDLNDRLNARLDAEGTFDIVQRDRIKSANLTLKGALSTHKWHAEESVRHIQDLQLFLRLKEIGVF